MEANSCCKGLENPENENTVLYVGVDVFAKPT